MVRRFDSDVAAGGDVIHVPTVEGLTANNKTAGSNITYEADTEGEKTIALNVHKYAAVLIEDIVKAQSNYNLRQIYTSRMGYTLAKAMDATIGGLYSGLSQTVTAGAALEDSEVLTAIGYLDAADAPRDGRAFVIHSEAMADLRAVDKFVTYENTGSTGVQVGKNNGLIANVYGVDVYMSNNIVESAGTPNLLHNLMFHRDAFGLAVQQDVKMESEYSVDALGTKLAAHTIYGASELRDSWAVDVTLNS